MNHVEYVLLIIWTSVTVINFKNAHNKEKINYKDSIGVILPLLCAMITLIKIGFDTY